ncbi:MAG: PIG-L family deacetylase [Chloroflexi bacterium]|nr:PIG-L family deacetylase [Chloroflexota bacterium]
MATDIPTRVLAIMAHPDDCEFTSAGTFAKWVAEGSVVEYVLCTSGNKGTWDPNVTPEKIAAIREQEQLAAAKELGVAQCIFLRHNDGELETTLKFREELALVIRQRKPQVVVTHDPWRHYMIHPDHRAVGFTAIDAVAAARDHLYYPHQLRGELTPHRVEELYLFGPQEPNFWVDISNTFEKKLAALSKHKSQVSAIDDLRERLRDLSARWGKPQGLDLAEAFRRVEVL